LPVGKSGSARGDVAYVEVQHDSPQPYRIVLHGHRFAYGVALVEDSDPPALADLRLIAVEPNTPVEKNDVLAVANILPRLAAIAAKRGKTDDVAFDRATTEQMRAAMGKFGVDTSGITVHSWTAPGPVIVPKPAKRGRGRPPKSTEFYSRVAQEARAAEADPDRLSIAGGVQQRMAQWPEYNGDKPPLSSVERWIKQARKLKLYRGPRDKNTDADPHLEADK
jgi:hypothetical protein